MKSHPTVAILTSVLFLTLLLSACRDVRFNPELYGSWTGRHIITVRYEPRMFHYVFSASPDSLDLVLDIQASKQVTGRLGKASFETCSVHINRGWIGKSLGLGTDYVIKGKLVGSTFPGDSILEKEIKMPFNLEDGKLKGSLFMTTGIDLFPLSDLDLGKDLTDHE
ncbi:MAG TPA: hypothetical protein VFX48_04205 [Saprospiraceae bacterium]|nr:hypothetical protein [Saprospiraceae bacterium]